MRSTDCHPPYRCHSAEFPRLVARWNSLHTLSASYFLTDYPCSSSRVLRDASNLDVQYEDAAAAIRYRQCQVQIDPCGDHTLICMSDSWAPTTVVLHCHDNRSLFARNMFKAVGLASQQGGPFAAPLHSPFPNRHIIHPLPSPAGDLLYWHAAYHTTGRSPFTPASISCAA